MCVCGPVVGVGAPEAWTTLNRRIYGHLGLNYMAAPLGDKRSYFPHVSWSSDEIATFFLIFLFLCSIKLNLLLSDSPDLCSFSAHIVHCLHFIGRGWVEEQKQVKLTVVISHFRKDLKFVSDIEKEMEALVEAVNKVEIKTSNCTCL